MYDPSRTAGLASFSGAGFLPFTGLDIVSAVVIGFVLITAGLALTRVLPRFRRAS